jgi:putative ABC transport system permease protein
MIFENLRMAGRSIIGNKLRTFLTMLGIIIGVAAVVAINSIGQGVKQLITNEVSGLGANVLVITPGKMTSGGGGGFASGLGASTLTQQDVTTTQTNNYVSTVAPMSAISGIVANGSTQDLSSSILATTASYLQADPSQKIGSGRFLTSADANADVAVLTSDSRDTLFGKGANAINKTITLRGQDFTVIGVLQAPDASQSGFGSTTNSMVYIPTGTAQTLTKATLQINRIIAQAKSSNEVQPAVDSLTSQIKKNHGGQDDFSVLTQGDILSTFNTILSTLTSAISAIAAISLLVGGIGIMNIMLVSVTERTREIGLRKALGATSGMVLSQFLIEAVVVTVLGGAIGLGLAWLGGKAVARAVHLTPVLTVNTVVVAFVVSALVGIIFGIAPAIKAARMKPIDALRYE